MKMTSHGWVRRCSCGDAIRDGAEQCPRCVAIAEARAEAAKLRGELEAAREANATLVLELVRKLDESNDSLIRTKDEKRLLTEAIELERANRFESAKERELADLRATHDNDQRVIYQIAQRCDQLAGEAVEAEDKVSAMRAAHAKTARERDYLRAWQTWSLALTGVLLTHVHGPCCGVCLTWHLEHPEPVRPPADDAGHEGET